jgi:hypothetical protein
MSRSFNLRGGVVVNYQEMRAEHIEEKKAYRQFVDAGYATVLLDAFRVDPGELANLFAFDKENNAIAINEERLWQLYSMNNRGQPRFPFVLRSGEWFHHRAAKG